MARSSFGGTDYSIQTFNDVIIDLKNDIGYIDKVLDLIEKHYVIATEENYWEKKVPSDFKDYYFYSLKAFDTAKSEIEMVVKEAEKEVKEYHIKLLKNSANVFHKLNKDIHIYWNSGYPASMKDYGQRNFGSVEHIYCLIGDLAFGLMDNINCANRLKDFIGGKGIMNLEKYHILFLSSSPIDEDFLQVGKEARSIEEELQASSFREKFSFSQKTAVKPETLTKALLDLKPNIVHFSGHGDFDYIALEDDQGLLIEFPSESLEKLISMFSEQIKIVILNSCYSESQAEIISKFKIYVIGMSNSTSDIASIQFSKGFYQALGSGKEVPFAFEMGTVLYSAYDSIQTPTLWYKGKKLK